MNNLLTFIAVFVSFSFTATAQNSSNINTIKTLAFLGVDTLDLTSVPSRSVKIVRSLNAANTVKIERQSTVNAPRHITRELHKAGYFSLQTETSDNNLVVKPVKRFVSVGNTDIETQDVFIIYVNPLTPVKLRS